MTAEVLRRARWSHPEAGAAAVAALAWTLLLAPSAAGGAMQAVHERAHDVAPAPAEAGGWLLMITAMMVPAALPDVRRLALSALWDRRQRTIALFLAGYLALWLAFGALAATAGAMLQRVLGVAPSTLVALLLAGAALWELTPQKRRSLRACHIIAPLPPRGAKADAACAVAGLRYGWRCIVSCWALMLAMSVAGHGAVALMASLAVIAVAQRLTVRGARLVRPSAVLISALALLLGTAY